MTDPLSIAAGTAGFISLGIQVTQSLVRYYTSYRDQDSDVRKTADRLEGLLVTLQFLQEALARRIFRVGEADLRDHIEKSIRLCEDSIKELQEENEKFHRTPNVGVRAAIKTTTGRLQYPFRQSTLQKLDEDIGEIRENLKFALSVLQLNDSREQHDGLVAIKSLVSRVRADQVSASRRSWLGAPDVIVNHSQACARRTPGTGDWFVEGAQFKQWLDQSNSFLWLQGFAGCGKSVLCSSAIQSAFLHCHGRPRRAIAFFYFTFNDNSKQSLSSMLRALLLQLTNQLDDGEANIDRLEREYPQGPPSTQVLMQHLEKMLEEFEDTYILIDALDESPRHSQRGPVLEAIDAIRQWSIRSLHLLVTSRNEPDVRESLDPKPNEEVLMKNDDIDRDIENHISVRLDQDRKIRKWSAYHDRIKDELTRRAKGVFRWVECQLTSLSSCPRSEYHLERLLSSLPSSLDETYERMLCNIDQAHVEDAKRMLTLLCSAFRPLTVSELIDGIAIELSDQPRLNLKRRLCNTDDLHTICPGLIEISTNPSYLGNDEQERFEVGDVEVLQDGDSEDKDEKEPIEVDYSGPKERGISALAPPEPIVRIAHSSIQEYLSSKRIQQQDAKAFYLSPTKVDAEIAMLCIAYLLDEGVSRLSPDMPRTKIYRGLRLCDEGFSNAYSLNGGLSRLSGDVPLVGRHRRLKSDEYPFLGYAATYWHLHYEILAGSDPQLDQVALNFLWADPRFLSNWQYHDEYLSAEFASLGGLISPVYCVSLLGYNHSLEMLAEEEGEETSGAKYPWPSFSEQINAKCGYWGYPVLAAVSQGHFNTVQLLVRNGADVNVQAGKSRELSTPVHCASWSGNESVLRFLLDNGVDTNARDSRGRSALHTTCSSEYENVMAVVQLLIEHGADVNAQDFQGTSVLHLACRRSYALGTWHSRMVLVQLLINNGADVNARDYKGRSALLIACEKDHDDLVHFLFHNGADVFAPDTTGDGALEYGFQDLASNANLVQLLLDDGVEVNHPVGRSRAVEKVSGWGLKESIELLLKNGAIVNSHFDDGFYSAALGAAARGGREEIVELLLNHGATVNSRFPDGYYCRALEETLEGYWNPEHLGRITRLLLERGAIWSKVGRDRALKFGVDIGNGQNQPRGPGVQGLADAAPQAVSTVETTPGNDLAVVLPLR